MPLFAIPRHNQRRPASFFHHARGHDADHATMPALAIEHQAELSGEIGLGGKLVLNLADDPGLFRLTLQVELVELCSNLAAALAVLGRKKFDDVTGHIHASGGVDARADAKPNVAGG